MTRQSYFSAPMRVAAYRTAARCPATHLNETVRSLASERVPVSGQSCPTSHLCTALRSAALRRATLLASPQRMTARSPAPSGAGFRTIFLCAALRIAPPLHASQCGAPPLKASFHLAISRRPALLRISALHHSTLRPATQGLVT